MLNGVISTNVLGRNNENATLGEDKVKNKQTFKNFRHIRDIDQLPLICWQT